MVKLTSEISVYVLSGGLDATMAAGALSSDYLVCNSVTQGVEQVQVALVLKRRLRLFKQKEGISPSKFAVKFSQDGKYTG
jgi:hypothetical protein